MKKGWHKKSAWCARTARTHPTRQMIFVRGTSLVLAASLAALVLGAPAPAAQEGGASAALQSLQRSSWIEGFLDGISFSSSGDNAGIAAATKEKGVASGASKDPSSTVFGLAQPGSALSFVFPTLANPSPTF